jgi:hypothetical protein
MVSERRRKELIDKSDEMIERSDDCIAAGIAKSNCCAFWSAGEPLL